MKTTLKSFVLGMTVLVPGLSLACVETERGYLGDWTIKNSCGKTVAVAWCFGGGCRPDPEMARRLTPGFQLLAGTVKHPIHVIHCAEPRQFGEDGRCH